MMNVYFKLQNSGSIKLLFSQDTVKVQGFIVLKWFCDDKVYYKCQIYLDSSLKCQFFSFCSYFLKVVDVELHRNSLGDDFILSAPSSSSSSSSSSHLPFVGGSGSSSTAVQGSRRPSSPSQHTHDDQPSSDRGRQNIHKCLSISQDAT